MYLGDLEPKQENERTGLRVRRGKMEGHQSGDSEKGRRNGRDKRKEITKKPEG